MSQQQWLEEVVEGVIIAYTRRYEADLVPASRWINRAVRLRELRYQLAAYAPPVKLCLHPVPTERASTHLTTYGYWRGTPLAQIEVLTPSAEMWLTAGLSLAGLPQNSDEFRLKNAVHEFTHAVQLTVWREPRDSAYPKWWFEGLPEHDGIMETSPESRTATLSALKSLVHSQLTSMPGNGAREVDRVLSLHDGYSTGPLMVAFLVNNFGNGLIRLLLQEPATTFWPTLLEATTMRTAASLYDSFHDSLG